MQWVGIEVERQVIKLLSGYFPAGRLKIEAGSRLVEDLYVDSMSVIEIVMMLNDVFKVQLPSAEVAQWRAVADICHSIKRCGPVK